MRGGGGGFQSKIRAAQSKGVFVLSWITFLIALVGGAFVAEIFVGDFIQTILEALPWAWLPPVLLIVLVLGTAVDLFLDLTPNQMAVTSALLAPAVATAVDGKLGDKVSEWSEAAQGWVNGALVEWTGETSAVGLAVACIVATFLMSRRVIRKSAGIPAGV